jgi:chitodextrinase
MTWKPMISRLFALSLLVTTVGIGSPNPGQAATARTVSPSFFGMHNSSLIYQPWPAASFATWRTWDQWPGVTWQNVNPATGTYDWATLDQAVNSASSHGVDIVYTFGSTPAWASSNPTGTGCAYGNGTCYPPNLAEWQTFVTAITSRYKGKIRYWELWNEPNAPNFWRGSTAQMVSMAAAAYDIIRTAGGTVLSPAPQGTNAHLWLDTYFAGGGDRYTDVVAFHGYLYGAPEKIVTLAQNVKNVAVKYSTLNGKAVWDTEHSWGDSTWPVGADQDQQAAWLARFLPLSFSSGIERSIWYMWDGYDGQPQWGMLYNATIKQIQKTGIAYREVYKWLVDAAMEPCFLTGTIYQCRLTRPGGYEGLMIWASSDNPSYTTSFSVPDKYIQYRSLDSSKSSTAASSTLTLGMQPVLLENLTVGSPDTTSPLVPTGLAATSTSSSQVNLSWNPSIDNVGVTGYKIYRDGTQIHTTGETTYSDSGLAAGTKYSYTVAAYDAAGNTSAQSGAVTVTTPSSAESIVIGSRVMATTSVKVRSRASANKTSKILGTQPIGALGVVVAGPVQGSAYTWWKTDFDSGVDGWVVESSLAKVVTQ